MIGPRLFGIIVLLCALLNGAHVCGGGIDPAVLSQLRTTAVNDWLAAERAFHSVDVTYQSVYKSGSIGAMKVVSEQTFHLVYDAGRGITLFRTQRVGIPGHINHQVANSRYSFEVSAPDMNARGTLQKLTVNSQAGKLSELALWGTHRCYLQAECRLSCLQLKELLDDSFFEPVEAIEYQEQGNTRIRYVAKHLGEQGKNRVKGGIYTLEFDPTHRHRPTFWMINVPQSTMNSFRIAYHVSGDVRTPREIIRTSIHQGKSGSEETLTYDLPKPCMIPDAEFYLPHYGFSEQVLETLHPNPWPRWLLIGFGIVTIAIGAWLVRGRRQPAA